MLSLLSCSLWSVFRRPTSSPRPLRSRGDTVRPRCRRGCPLSLERLEERALLSGSGSFGLSPPPPEPPAVLLDASGSAFQAGAIATAGERDLFRFVAPVTTRTIIRQSAAFGSSLDSVLTVSDASRTRTASNDDLTPDTRDSQVLFDVAGGQTYLVEAAGFEGSTGGYALTFSSFAGARALALGDSGSGSLRGSLGRPGAADLFRFVAPLTGRITVRQEGTAGSSLDSVLTVFDGSKQLLTFNDDSGGTRDSEVRFAVTAGETYYVQAAGFDTSTGGYLLTLSTVPFSAKSLVVGPEVGMVSGTIGAPGGSEFFGFVAPNTGRVFFGLLGPEGGSLDGALTVFDSSLRAAAFRNESGGTRDRVVSFDVTGAQTYYVRAAGVGASTGSYTLAFLFVGPGEGSPVLQLPNIVGDGEPGAAAKTGSAAKDALVVIPAPVSPAPGPAVRPLAPGDASVPAREGGPPRAQIAALGPAGDSSLVLVVTVLTGGGHPAESTLAAVPVGEAPLTRAVVGTPGRGAEGTRASGLGEDRASEETVFVSIERTLGDSLLDAARDVARSGQYLANSGLAALGRSLAPLGPVLAPLAGGNLEILDAFWQELASGVARAALSAAREVGPAIRLGLGGRNRSPAPVPPAAAGMAPEMGEDEMPDAFPSEVSSPREATDGPRLPLTECRGDSPVTGIRGEGNLPLVAAVFVAAFVAVRGQTSGQGERRTGLRARGDAHPDGATRWRGCPGARPVPGLL